MTNKKLLIEKIFRGIYRLMQNNKYTNMEREFHIWFDLIQEFMNFIREFDKFEHTDHYKITKALYFDLSYEEKTLENLAYNLNLSVSTLQRYRIMYCDYLDLKIIEKGLSIQKLTRNFYDKSV